MAGGLLKFYQRSIQFPRLFGVGKKFGKLPVAAEKKPDIIAIDETVVKARKKLGFIPLDVERNELAGVY